MKKLIYGGLFLFILSIGMTSCEKEAILPNESPEVIKTEAPVLNNGYDRNNVESVLKAAGISVNSTGVREGTTHVEVLSGRWDGDMNSDSFNCIGKEGICAIIVTYTPERSIENKQDIIFPTENKPTKIIGRISDKWETTDENEVKTVHYSYEKL